MTCPFYDYLKSSAAEKDDKDVAFLVNLVTDRKVITESDRTRFHQKLIALTPRQRTEFWIQMRTLLTEPEWNFAHDLYVRTVLRQKWGKGS